jgi:hypothetical protein
MDVMADDTKRASRDGRFLSLEQDWEAEYWAKRFGVSRESLEQAVAAVGGSAANVGAYLNDAGGSRVTAEEEPTGGCHAANAPG